MGLEVKLKADRGERRENHFFHSVNSLLHFTQDSGVGFPLVRLGTMRVHLVMTRTRCSSPDRMCKLRRYTRAFYTCTVDLHEQQIYIRQHASPVALETRVIVYLCR